MINPNFKLTVSCIAFLFFLSSTNLLASNGDPIYGCIKVELFNNSNVSYSIINSDAIQHFASVSYNSESEYFSVKTFQTIKFIQVFEPNGELLYQIPVENSLVHLSLEDFNSGAYDVYLTVDGVKEKLMTQLIKK